LVNVLRLIRSGYGQCDMQGGAMRYFAHEDNP
jgi:hypothetical protein